MVKAHFLSADRSSRERPNGESFPPLPATVDKIPCNRESCEVETFYFESQLNDESNDRMKKKRNAYNFNNRRKVNVIQSVPAMPMRYVPRFCPTNLLEQKENFLRHGIVPNFNFKTSAEAIEKISNSQFAEIKFDLLPEAKRILELTKSKYGSVDAYTAATFGERIDYLEASAYLSQYLSQHKIDGSMRIIWSPDLNCSAQMMWHGPGTRYNRPEARKYTLCVKKSSENAFLRENGIKALADHEIGTHFFRMLNDGFQVWFSDRARFGLTSLGSREMLCTEEGLACVNTLLQAKCKLLSLAALLYYTACMSTKMSFRALFDHLEIYVKDPEQRCKHVMRVKRGQKDPNKPGGYGKDQCYFEGAVEILRNVDRLDFQLLMCGKIHLDEVHRVRRMVRQDCVKMPYFLRDQEKYKQQLRHIANVNGVAHYSRATRRRRPVTSASTNQSETQNQLRSSSEGAGLVSDRTKSRRTCWTKSDSRKKLLQRSRDGANTLGRRSTYDGGLVEDTVAAALDEADRDVRAFSRRSCRRASPSGAGDEDETRRFGTLRRFRKSPIDGDDGEVVVTRFGTLRRLKQQRDESLPVFS